MPGAERRRQHEAYRSGVLRTAAIAGGMFLALFGIQRWNEMRSAATTPTVSTIVLQPSVPATPVVPPTLRPSATPKPTPTPMVTPEPTATPKIAGTPSPRSPQVSATPRPPAPKPAATPEPTRPAPAPAKQAPILVDIFHPQGTNHGWKLEVDEGEGAVGGLIGLKDGSTRFISGTATGYEGYLRAIALLPDLQPDTAYVLVFEARAGKAREITVRMQHNYYPWDELGLFDRPQLNENWQTYRWEFTTPDNTEKGQGSLVLGLSQDTGTVDIRNVHVYQVP